MSGSKVVARMSEFWKANVLEPMLAFSEKGVPAEEVALCLVLGLVLGVCPIFGCPTIFCAMAALFLRLKLPAIQLVNYLAYPLQLTLLVPFVRLGGWLFRGGQGSAAVSRAFPWQAVHGVVTAGWHAAVAWFFVCAPAGLILYVCLVCILRRYRTQLAPAC